MKRTVGICIMALFFFLACRAVPADAYERGRPWLSDQPWEKCSLTLGFFLTNFTSDVSLGAAGGGLVLNLEDALGLDSTTAQFRLDAEYRAWRRHHFYFSYYDLSRNADKTLDFDIPEEDIKAGGLAETKFDLKIYKAGYFFSFWNDDRVDLGVGLGFHILDVTAKLRVSGEGSAGGEEGSFDEQILAESTTLPLPVLGLRGNIAITKRVFLKQSFDVFYIDLSGFEGLLMDANIALEGHVCRFFGLGMGFNFLHIQIDGDGGDDFLGGGWNGKLDFDYSGVALYGKFFF